MPIIIVDTLSYVPWGGDNNMPFDILKLIEDDKTLSKNTTCRKVAVVSRIPTSDSTYYPIPYYASLFKGKCYNIKQLTSSQASFFGETLFPYLAITDQVKGTGSKWERYLALRPMILDIEASLAEEFFSPELMVRLRNEVLCKMHTADLARVINAIRGQVVDLLNGGSIRMRDMIDVVNHIRRFPDLFPEWHASETAKLFAPPIFKNKKEARGYFF